MPDIWMDVDIALSEVPVNRVPLIDDGDFKSRKTGLAYNAAGMDLVWNFVTTAGAFTQTAVTPTTGGAHDWTDQGDAMYTIEIPASSPGDVFNDTEGFGWFTGIITGVLPWAGPTIGFRAATINDALIDSDTLLTAKDIGLLYESEITTVTSQTQFIMTVAFAVDNAWLGNTISLEDVSTGEIYTGDIWVSNTVQSTETIQINTAFPVTVVTGDKLRIYTEQHPTYSLNLYDPPTRSELTTDTNTILGKLLAYVQLMVRKDSAIATDNATEVTAINTDEGSGSGTYDNTTDSLEASRIAIYESTIGTVTTQTDFILDENITTDDNWVGHALEIEDVTTGEINIRRITNVVAATDEIWVDAAPDFTVVATDIVRVRSIHPTQAFNLYDPPTRAELTSDTDSILSKMLNYFRIALRNDVAVATDNATEFTAVNSDQGSGGGTYQRGDAIQDIKSDTGNTLTTVGNIQVKTDDLTFTVTNEVDVNIQSVNNVTVSGDGGSGTEWGPI